jgi:K(+)-stimulated pyrophosphate-energized sodium pump
MAGLFFTGAPVTTGPVLTGTDQTVVTIVAIVAVAALGVAWLLVRQVLAFDEGTDAMKRIATAVQEGANAYLARQFRTLGGFAGAVVFLLLLLPADTWSQRIGRSVFFLVGAAFSAITGYIGMRLAVRSNVRVAAAAPTGRPRPLNRTSGASPTPPCGSPSAPAASSG